MLILLILSKSLLFPLPFLRGLVFVAHELDQLGKKIGEDERFVVFHGEGVPELHGHRPPSFAEAP